MKRSRIDDDDIEDRDTGFDSSPPSLLLVVNDEPDSCELIARLVEALGWRVARLHDPGQAVGELLGASFAGAIVDLSGGVEASTEMVREIRDAGGDLAKMPLLVLTSTGGDEAGALRAGADGFLARPFHANDLAGSVEVAFGKVPGSNTGEGGEGSSNGEGGEGTGGSLRTPPYTEHGTRGDAHASGDDEVGAFGATTEADADAATDADGFGGQSSFVDGF